MTITEKNTQQNIEKRIYSKLYYEKNRFQICKNLLYKYVPNKISTIRSLIPDKIEEYYVQYPYEQFSSPIIKKALKHFKISPNSIAYHECISAGSDAYMFGIHQCAIKDYAHVAAYIKKITPIFMMCAINISDEAKQIRRATGFTIINLDNSYRF